VRVALEKRHLPETRGRGDRCAEEEHGGHGQRRGGQRRGQYHRVASQKQEEAGRVISLQLRDLGVLSPHG
jgi:hypothetical protein